MKILAISGSLRADSFNTKLLKEALQYLPATISTEIHSISEIPLYNQDVEDAGNPESVQRFKDAIDNADALLIASPEYNTGIPGGLKNAIDWASRPAFESVLKDKPTAIITAAASGAGGANAYAALKPVLSSTLTPLYTEREFALGAVYKAFDDQGRLVNNEDKIRLQEFITGFINWLENLEQSQSA